ncbi:thiamine pyrophosphate-binding protein [Nocardioides sp. AN3]
MTTRTGGDLLVDLLRAHDVDTVFGIVSVHNLPLVEAVDRDLRFVPVRHEATAVNAADGYARARGGLGCALTSTGTGAGNAAGSLVESLSSGTSVLHVTGQVDSPYLGSGRGFIHETKDQLGMLTAVSAYAATITDTDSAATVLTQATARALAVPGGPASVEWPIDLQYAEHSVVPISAAVPPPAGGPEGAAISEAARLLAASERPVIWAGGGVAGAGRPLERLVELLGGGLLTSNSGRGAVPEDHDLCIGNYGTAPGARALLRDSDLLVSIGTHFRSNETADYTIPVPSAHVQVDVDPAALGRVFPVTLGVVADAREFLEAVIAELAAVRTQPPSVAWTDRVRAVRADVRAQQRAGLGDHAVFADSLRAVLPRRAPIVRDVTIASSSWGNRLLEIRDPRDNIFPRGGGIGQGLGMAIGAALGRPGEPSVCIAGDGGLAVHLGELMTLAQESPWLVLLVFNDRGYGVLRNMQDQMGRPRAGVDLATPHYGTLCQALGLPHLLVDDPSALTAALEKAVALRGPVMVEVDLTVFPPMASPFTPPVHVPGASS